MGIADAPPNLLFIISHFQNWQYAIAFLVIDFLLMRSPAKLPKTSQHLPPTKFSNYNELNIHCIFVGAS
ncbi:MAG: hypothetical protein IM596_15820 [Pseudanabaena sp. M051S1SP2A07QC]|nr:hypothetical protein [Pseudanabaena sp. M051S1SP2A07QC]